MLLTLALALVGANAFFVAAEFALVKVRVTRLDELAKAGSGQAARTRDMARQIDAYLSACQLGITLASLGLGWIGEPAFARLIRSMLGAIGLEGSGWVHGFEVATAFVIITSLHIVLGELAPKSLAIQYTEQVALGLSWPLHVFFRVSAPFIHGLNWAGNAAVRALGLPPPDHGHEGHTTAELRLMLHESHRSGILGLSERQLLDNAFEFSSRTVREIMRPRGDVTYLSLAQTLEESLEHMRTGAYTRFPLCKSDLDEVVGLIHVKDLLFPSAPLATPEDLSKLKRPILFVPEMIGIPALLAQMRHTKMLMAIAVDEYGVVTGMCTLEDIIEELVGEIQDEHDQEHPQIRSTRDGGFLVEGTVVIRDLCRHLMLEIPPSGADTISGYVLGRIGRMAREGDTLTVQNYLVTVVEVRGFRLARLLFTPIAPRGADDRSAPRQR